MRKADMERVTSETQIGLSLELDGTGKSTINTGIGFFDHMLTAFAVHGGFDLDIACKGDLHVDCHHTVEDVGIVLGQAFQKALGGKEGIARYGNFTIPMDEALASVSLDISARPYLVFHATFTNSAVGGMDTCMVQEFFRAFAFQAGITLHINVPYGTNDHHMIEAIFKAVAHALRGAVTVSGNKVLSSKGVL